MTLTTETPSAATRVELLRLMVMARQLDAVIASVNPHFHCSYGEEAVPVGCFKALRPTDISMSHYRSGLLTSMVRGVDLRRLIAGALGKVTGPGRGRSRAALMGDVGPNHFAMFSGTLGPTLGLAAGAALAAKLEGNGRVAVVTFGDGTVNSGLFHESMNLAGMLRLPVVFVCQDNQYAITMKAEVAISGSILQRGSGYGMPAVEVDGNDAVAVFSAVLAATNRARVGEGPSFIHALSYRLGGHWATDPAAYRSEDEVRYWATREPISRLAKSLVAEGVIGPTALQEMEDRELSEAKAALALAEADPWPGAEVIEGDAYAPSHYAHVGSNNG